MDNFYQAWLKFVDNTIARMFDSILVFLKSKNGLYITIAIIAFFILY